MRASTDGMASRDSCAFGLLEQAARLKAYDPRMDLNPAQHDAVNTLSGPLLVLAGAGTGKTRVVTYRIAELIRSRVRPDRVLAVTFTNKAADEMQERAAALLGKRLKQRPEISTFHSLCARILRRHIRQLGYPANFAIYDRGDQEAVARSALREIKVADGLLRPSDLLYFIGRWKNASVVPEEAAATAQTDKEHLAAAAYRRYQNALKAAGAVDFDDLLLCTEELLKRFPKVRQAEAGRFDHLLVDEYQDTNGSQYRIVKSLAAGHRNLCVVGDDDQSIYGWRGRRRRSHPAIQERLARGQGRPARGQLPFDPRNPGVGQSPDRVQQAAARQEAPGDVCRRTAASQTAQGRERRGEMGCRPDRLRHHRAKAATEGLCHPLPNQRAAPGV